MRWNENEESNNFKSNPIWRKFLVNFSAIFFGASIFVFVITKRHKINLITAFERKMWTTKSKKRAEHTAHGCRDENSFKTDLERGTNCVLWFCFGYCCCVLVCSRSLACSHSSLALSPSHLLFLSRPFILFIAIDIYSQMYGRCCHPHIVLTFLFLFWHKWNAISGIAELCKKKHTNKN